MTKTFVDVNGEEFKGDWKVILQYLMSRYCAFIFVVFITFVLGTILFGVSS